MSFRAPVPVPVPVGGTRDGGVADPGAGRAGNVFVGDWVMF